MCFNSTTSSNISLNVLSFETADIAVTKSPTFHRLKCLQWLMLCSAHLSRQDNHFLLLSNWVSSWVL